MSRPTAFLTGGTGFVGGHVARSLCAEGWTVRALARTRGVLASGASRKDLYENLTKDGKGLSQRLVSAAGAYIEIDTQHQHQLTGLLDGLGDDPATESME